MSKYTTELRFICESAAGLKESEGYNDIENIIQKAIPFVFDFDFPMFNVDYKNVLCTKIIKHYYTREISEETVGLWKLRLNAKMNEIMPYYNSLYKAWSVDFNPLFDIDLTRKHTLDRDGTQKTNVHNESVTRDLYSDTPQGSLQNVENETYLTDARKTSVSADSDSTSNATTTDEFLERVTGKNAGKSYSMMLKEYREALINIDLLIIDELQDLFFKLW